MQTAKKVLKSNENTPYSSYSTPMTAICIGIHEAFVKNRISLFSPPPDEKYKDGQLLHFGLAAASYVIRCNLSNWTQ
jgi:hypothetical protein